MAQNSPYRLTFQKRDLEGMRWLLLVGDMRPLSPSGGPLGFCIRGRIAFIGSTAANHGESKYGYATMAIFKQSVLTS